jgi:S-methylmethionine-dependent homocysteine/selenocysteine methylase
MSYAPIRERLQRGEVIVLDGAIGTEILRRDVTWADHQLKKRPDVVRAIHSDYINAGAHVISTNTFQLTRRAFLNHFRDRAHVAQIGMPDLETRWADLLRAGVRLAHEARASAAAEQQVAIAGAMTTLEWCFRPDLAPTEREALSEYREIVDVFADAGCDLLLIETVNSIGEAAAAATAARDRGIPYWIAFVCDERGRLFSGETMDQAERALAPLDPGVILLNCAPPPDIEAGLRELQSSRRGPVGAYPHIGRFDPPEWLFTDEYLPDRYLDVARNWVDAGVRVIGGCCGTTPQHIERLAKAFA